MSGVDYSRWDNLEDDDDEPQAKPQPVASVRKVADRVVEAKKLDCQPTPKGEVPRAPIFTEKLLRVQRQEEALRLIRALAEELPEAPSADPLSSRSVQRALESGKPTLLRGACTEWVATKRWSWEFFVDCFGDTSVKAGGWGQRRRARTLKSLIANWWPEERCKLESAKTSGCHSWRAFDECRELFTDIELARLRGIREVTQPAATSGDDRCAGSRALSRTALCIGEAGFVATPLRSKPLARHCWLASVRGAQRYVIVTKAGAAYLDSRPGTKARFEPALKRLRLPAKEIDGFSCTLQEGDVLLVPSGCLLWSENLWASLVVRRCFVTQPLLTEFQQWLLHASLSGEIESLQAGRREPGGPNRAAAAYAEREFPKTLGKDRPKPTQSGLPAALEGKDSTAATVANRQSVDLDEMD